MLKRPRLHLFLFCLVLGAAGCPSPPPKYPICERDKDCRPGEKCVNKRCQKCAGDADCGPGSRCVNGACETIPGWCSGDGDCEAGMVCKDYQCVRCQADADCGAGGRCVDGSCLRKGQCRNDEDCAEDEDCVNGVCAKAAVPSGEPTPKCTPEPIYFGYDQYTLDDAAKAILQRSAECLSSTPRKVTVLGHTDPRGTDEYNIGLSDSRAQAVITYLVRLGIDPGRMRKVPKGESEATGNDESGWTRDRRVELVWE